MNMAVLSDRFYTLVAPDIPNEWDVEEILEPYLKENDQFCQEVFSHIPSIWPISNSLCYDFLRLAPEAKNAVDTARLPQWVCEILDCYEKDGLRATQRFMNETTNAPYGSHCNTGHISLNELENRLLAFIRGVSGRDLYLHSSPVLYTDTETIFVPPELCLFPPPEENLLLYKLMLAFQWGYIRCGTFTVAPDVTTKEQEDFTGLWINDFLKSFAAPLLARDLYFFLETVRIRDFLSRELPGLIRTSRKLSWPQIVVPDQSSLQAIRLTELQNLFLKNELGKNPTPPSLKDYLKQLQQEGASAHHSIQCTKEWYKEWSTEADHYEGVESLPFQGEVKLSVIEIVRQTRLQRIGEEFIDSLAAHLVSMPKESLDRLLESEKQKNDGSGMIESDITMIMDAEFAQTVDEHQAPLLLTINNEEIELPEDILQQTEKVVDEFGHLPGRLLSSAVGKAGDSMPPETSSMRESADAEGLSAPICYDEWDYRRQGFRKQWCVVNLKELPEVRSGFIGSTLNKYHGLMTRLRYQFEMIRTTDRFVKGQRDGDDIDLDALIDSLADTRAGLPPSDRLFTRLMRDERDINVIFLVDMSNSTVGWVGTTIKESLVLMTEALEILGDRYGIYGFSGMKRTRCELFHVKHLHEPAGETVRKRIGAISPREYTRMGPAIRHCTNLLTKTDSRVRLLITITDGKPEDYDDYKGEYAIEDTRHALLEAKTMGTHPFCITIDHHAHDYMDHMYGPVNYVFVNDIRKLPMRMPEIYRVLTT